jgi:hypothetical protein
MKKIGFFLLMLIVRITNMSAQSTGSDVYTPQNEPQKNRKEFKTIFGDSRTSFSGFGAPIMSFTKMDGEFAYLFGGGGGLLINQRMFIGGYGLGMTSKITPKISTLKNFQVDYSEGGFWYGWIFAPNSPVHPKLTVLTGWGTVKFDGVDPITTLPIKVNDKIFAVTPAIELEANIASWFRMSVGANYRFLSGIDRINDTLIDLNSTERYKNDDFSSAGVYVTFLFGGFEEW